MVKAENVMFWLLVIPLFLVCTIPFNYLPQATFTLFTVKWPIHHLIFTSTGLVLLITTLTVCARNRFLPVYFLFALAVWASMLLSSVFSPANRPEALQTSAGFLLRAMAPSLAAYLLVRYAKREAKLQMALIVVVTIAAAIAIYEPLTGTYLIERYYVHGFGTEVWPPSYGYAVGAIGQPLPLSIFLTILFPFTVASWGKINKTTYVLINCLVIGTVIMTFRRTGYLFLLLGAGLVLWNSTLPKKKMLLWGGIISLVLAFFVAIIPESREKMRRFSPSIAVDEFANKHRGKAYQVSYRMFTDHPLLGIGTRQYFHRYKEYADYPLPDNSPDSQYLRFLAEGGALGLSTFLLFMGYVLKRVWTHAKKPEGAPYLASLTALALGFVVNDSLYWPAIQMTAFVIIGMAMGRIDREVSA